MNSPRFQSLDPSRRFGLDAASRLAEVRAKEDERWKRARSIGIIGTVIIHFLILILFRQASLPPAASTPAAGPPMGDIRAAEAGGSGMTMMDVRPEQPQEEQIQQEETVPEPVVVPVPTETMVEPEDIEVAAPDPGPPPAPSLEGSGGPGRGGEDGAEAGPGSATGQGEGGGGTSEEGAPRVIPPRPRGVFIPPSGRPNSARGQEITVWVFVQENGRVDRNTVRLDPPTSDGRYNQRLIQSVAEWVFDPATQGGDPVPVWYPFEIVL